MNNTETRPAVAGTLAHLAGDPRPTNMGAPRNAHPLSHAAIDGMVAASRAILARTCHSHEMVACALCSGVNA